MSEKRTEALKKAKSGKIAERVKYFSGKRGHERYNNLTSEGRVRSGVQFSYHKQDMEAAPKKGKKEALKYLGHNK